MNNLVSDVKQLVEDGMILDVDGEKYSPVELYKVCDKKAPVDIVLQTLCGLAGYMEANIDGLDRKKCLIVVGSYQGVALYKQIDPKTQKRFNYINVGLNKCGKEFPFDRFTDSENFMIKLQSMFEDVGDLKELRAFVSRLTINNLIATRDDGVSQEVVVKKGLSGALKESQVAPAILNLTPRRTFTEVTQPSSRFLFRMKAVEGGLPMCALFEADGGAWKVDAMNNIKDWLEENIKDVSIIA